MDDGTLVGVVDRSHDAILSSCLETTRMWHSFEKKPSICLSHAREGELEVALGLVGEPGSCLLGDVCGMIVEDQLDRGIGRMAALRSLRNAMNSRLRR
jgi:hypothetical protein